MEVSIIGWNKAEELRDRAKRARKKLEMFPIYSKIDEAADAGEFYIHYEEKLNEFQLKELAYEGFIVEKREAEWNSESYYYISWEEQD